MFYTYNYKSRNWLGSEQDIYQRCQRKKEKLLLMTLFRLVLEEIKYFSFLLQNSHILRIACFIICTSCKKQGVEKASLTPTRVRNTFNKEEKYGFNYNSLSFI